MITNIVGLIKLLLNIDLYIKTKQTARISASPSHLVKEANKANVENIKRLKFPFLMMYLFKKYTETIMVKMKTCSAKINFADVKGTLDAIKIVLPTTALDLPYSKIMR